MVDLYSLITVLFVMFVPFLSSISYSSEKVRQCGDVIKTNEWEGSPVNEKNRTNIDKDLFFGEMERLKKITKYELNKEEFALFHNQTKNVWSLPSPGKASGQGNVQFSQVLFFRGLSPNKFKNKRINRNFEQLFESPFTLSVFRQLKIPKSTLNRPILNFENYLTSFTDAEIQYPVDSGFNLLVDPADRSVQGSFEDRKRSILINSILRQLSFSELYGNYAHQGPERSQFLEQYQYQDKISAHRSLNFIITLSPYAEPTILGHFQVQTSMGPQEPLNVEMNFGPISRPSNSKAVELGRLFLDLVGWEKKDWMVNDYLKHSDVTLFLRSTLYQKALTWLAWDYQPEAIFAQVNTEKKDKFMSTQSPLKFTSATPLKESNGKEWLLTMSREDLLLSESRATINLIKATMGNYKRIVSLRSDIFDRVEESGTLNRESQEALILKFDRNQFACLERIGLLRWEDFSENERSHEDANYEHFIFSGEAHPIHQESLYRKGFLLIEVPVNTIDQLKKLITGQTK